MGRSTPPHAVAGATRRTATHTQTASPADRPATVLVASDWAPIRAFEPIVRDAPEADLRRSAARPAPRRPPHRQLRVRADVGDAPVWKSGAVFKGEPAHVAGLTAVPFDVACLANNHVLDYGVAGLREHPPRAHASAASGPSAPGSRRRRPARRSACASTGQAIHIVNISEGEDLTASTGGPGVFGWDMPLAAAQARALKKTRRRGDRDRALRAGVRAVPAALRRLRVPGACRGWRRLRHRPSSARAPGHRMVARPSDSLQPRQLRVLSAHDAAPSEDGFLRELPLRRRPDHGARTAPVPDHGRRACGVSTRTKRRPSAGT